MFVLTLHGAAFVRVDPSCSAGITCGKSLVASGFLGVAVGKCLIVMIAVAR